MFRFFKQVSGDKLYKFKLELGLTHGDYVYKSAYFIKELLGECNVLGISVIRWNKTNYTHEVTVKLRCTSVQLSVLLDNLAESFPELEIISFKKS